MTYDAKTPPEAIVAGSRSRRRPTRAPTLAAATSARELAAREGRSSASPADPGLGLPPLHRLPPAYPPVGYTLLTERVGEASAAPCLPTRCCAG